MLALCRRPPWLLRSTPALRALVLLAITLPRPWLAEAAAAPKAYVGLFKDNAIAVLDTGGNRVQGTIPVPQGPHGIVITPDGRKVYVSSDGASTVSVIDTQTDTVVKSIEMGPTPMAWRYPLTAARCWWGPLGRIRSCSSTPGRITW